MNVELRAFSEDRSPQALSVSQAARDAGVDVLPADAHLMEQGQEGVQAGDAGMVRAAESTQKPEKRARRRRFGRWRKDSESETTGLSVWRAVARRNLFTVGIFSLFVNLFMLTIPIYLFELSDRVLTSRSLDTLVMLSLLAMGFMIVMSLLDILRKQVLGRVATQFETILGGIVLAGMVGGPRREEGGNANAMRQLHQVRGFISGPVMLNLFDAPMEAWLDAGDFDTFLTGYERFRARVIECAGNPLAAQMLDSIYEKTKVLIRRIVILPGRARMGLGQHRATVAAMRAGNADEAERLKRENLEGAKEYLRRFRKYVL